MAGLLTVGDDRREDRRGREPEALSGQEVGTANGHDRGELLQAHRARVAHEELPPLAWQPALV